MQSDHGCKNGHDVWQINIKEKNPNSDNQTLMGGTKEFTEVRYKNGHKHNGMHLYFYRGDIQWFSGHKD